MCCTRSLFLCVSAGEKPLMLQAGFRPHRPAASACAGAAGKIRRRRQNSMASVPATTSARPTPDFLKGAREKRSKKTRPSRGAQLVDGDDHAGGAVLQRPVVAQPRRAGRKAGEHQEQPGAAGNGSDLRLRADEKHHEPRKHEHHNGADRRRPTRFRCSGASKDFPQAFPAAG